MHVYHKAEFLQADQHQLRTWIYLLKSYKIITLAITLVTSLGPANCQGRTIIILELGKGKEDRI